MSKMIPVGVSNRHLHISRADLDVLFGQDYQLKPMKDLSQPGQYACEETIDLVTEKGTIDRVRILGPERKQTQIELAVTDSFKLGLKPPVRDSGSLKDSPGVTIVGPKGKVTLSEGVILAWRHIHMTIADANALGLKDKDMVSIKTTGDRAVIFENVLVRANDAFALEMHIDTDEANAAQLKNGAMVELIK